MLHWQRPRYEQNEAQYLTSPHPRSGAFLELAGSPYRLGFVVQRGEEGLTAF